METAVDENHQHPDLKAFEKRLHGFTNAQIESKIKPHGRRRNQGAGARAIECRGPVAHLYRSHLRRPAAASGRVSRRGERPAADILNPVGPFGGVFSEDVGGIRRLDGERLRAPGRAVAGLGPKNVYAECQDRQ